jgi:hypothetical protein
MGLQTAEGSANAETGEAVLGDRRVDDALGAELLEQALAHLVGALIFGDFLAHQEDLGIAAHFLGHRIAQGFAHGVGRSGTGIFRFGGRCLHDGGSGDLGGCRRSRCGGGRCRLGSGCRTRRFVFAAQDGDRRVDGDILGPGFDQDLFQDAFVDGFHFHGRLVGLDLSQDVAGLYGIAGALQPFGQLALGHGGRQGGHQNLGGHVCSLPFRLQPGCRSTSPMDPVPARIERIRWPARRCP